jgi:hypothetical protein
LGAPISSSACCQSVDAWAVPNRIFLNSFGNSFSKKSSSFFASAVPAAYSIPA